MQIKTTDLPGIGRRYSFKTVHGEQLTVILHHNGNREIYHFSRTNEDDPDFAIILTDEESRQLGTILLGVDYQPVSDDRVELFLKNVRLEWIRVEPESCLVNKRIIDSQIRTRTGSTIIGIQRGDTMIGSPDINEIILAGDVLLAIGNREQTKSLDNMCKL